LGLHTLSWFSVGCHLLFSVFLGSRLHFLPHAFSPWPLCLWYLYVCSNCCYWFQTSAFLSGIVNLVISFIFW
jgi:hypothetical protein